MRILVAYASRAGSTKGIAEFIGERLQSHGMQCEIRDVKSAGEILDYDAFVIGSAAYIGHWMKEARQFVTKNWTVLADRPVWLFSSGPTGTRPTDSKGRDLKEVSVPKEIDEFHTLINPRDHRVFFGALLPDHLTGAVAWFSRRIPKEDQGDFRDWKDIGDWADSIAKELDLMNPLVRGP